MTAHERAEVGMSAHNEPPVDTQIERQPADYVLAVGSLFSGIGGIDLGLERLGMRVIWQAETDPYASAVLAKHWPEVPNLGDVTTIDWSTVERPDVICGGFPCQPVSLAGRGRAQADERWLWPDYARAIRHLRPRYVVVENVPGLLVRGMGDVLGELAALGFDAEWSVLSACALGAPHTRERVFVLAYAHGERRPGWADAQPGRLRGWAPTEGHGASAWGEGTPEPDLGRVAYGVPRRLDRLRCLGNAVVPQVAEWVGRQIIAAHNDLEAVA